ncbi:MAG: signal recognition particle-docking protein FtsY [Nanoarchaeota archaeon]
MFGFLKDKLKSAISNFTKKVKDLVEDEELAKPFPKAKKKKEVKKKEVKLKKEKVEVKSEFREIEKKIEEAKEKLVETQEEKKGFFSKLFGKKEKIEEKPEIKEKTEEEVEKEIEKKGFFTKISEAVTKTSLSEEKFDVLFWDLEVILLENNVAVEVIEKIKIDMKEILVKGKISRFDVEKTILETLKKSIDQILTFDKIDLLKEAKSKKPLILSFVGVNGSGKTTSIAKLANYFQKNKLKVVMAASDTFRAAAIQQLEEHANKLNIKLIKHDYGSDPAAVAFDAVKYAQANGVDIVMIDTAGRLHSNTNLMEEMKKIIRVAKPHYKIFVGESITGNDCVEQAQQFNEAVGVDGIILSKADVDEKGGAAISVSYVTKKPIMYIGTGQTYDDIEPFNKEKIIKTLGL